MLSERGIRVEPSEEPFVSSVTRRAGTHEETIMQISTPAQQLGITPECSDTDSAAAIVTHDNYLVSRLQDLGLRRLCTCAAGLSRHAQRRLEAVAEALRSSE